ncbi:MAG: permease-like cell division protein FtsX [Clostridia bacterium]|nr:permease-like cell division protein FtsX [Clostridia bacterium]
MNIHNFKYFLKEGFKNLWINRVMSAASMLVMTCCMILTGGAVLLSYNVNAALKSVENKNSITVFLNSDIKSSNVKSVGEKISSIDNVIACDYYSSQQAAEKYEEVLGTLYDVVCEKENPFPEAFHVTMEDLSLYNDTVSEIKNIPEVDSVSDRSETAQKLTNLSHLIAHAGVWIVCSLGVVSLFIISNTIRISMHSRRFEISIMKSVGATNSFIRAPFIVEGIIIGFVSAALSTVILDLIYDVFWAVISEIMPFSGVYCEDMFWKLFGAFLISGVVFGIIGSYISIRKYLIKEGGEVVAW